MPDSVHFKAQLHDADNTERAATMIIRAPYEDQAKMWARDAANAMGMVVADFYPTPPPPIPGEGP